MITDDERFQVEMLAVLREIRGLLQPEPLQSVQVSQGNTPSISCFACVENYFIVQKDIRDGVLHNGETPSLPDINPAETYAPCWLAKDVGGAIAWACIVLPTCMKHLQKEQETPLQRATRSGLALPPSGIN